MACSEPTTVPLLPAPRGFGTGVTKSAGLRLGTTSCVGWPSPSKRQCLLGAS